jgi:hypothetical protein
LLLGELLERLLGSSQVPVFEDFRQARDNVVGDELLGGVVALVEVDGANEASTALAEMSACERALPLASPRLSLKYWAMPSFSATAASDSVLTRAERQLVRSPSGLG